jgi:septum site-determining protein MinC
MKTTEMFRIKGGLYTPTSLQLLGTQLELLESQLIAKIKQAPKFFHSAPIVIDFQKIQNLELPWDMAILKALLEKQGLIPVGVKGANAIQQTLAKNAGLAILQTTETADALQEATQAATSPAATARLSEAKANPLTRIIHTPVRSGQQIYARGGDLIILSSVSPGSEILADGNIHVYGPLRGRALAGIEGNTQAHIFCQSLEAELVSIAGQYRMSEDIESTHWRLAVDIFLEGDRLRIRPL